jgi:hypothetical protein
MIHFFFTSRIYITLIKVLHKIPYISYLHEITAYSQDEDSSSTWTSILRKDFLIKELKKCRKSENESKSFSKNQYYTVKL